MSLLAKVLARLVVVVLSLLIVWMVFFQLFVQGGPKNGTKAACYSHLKQLALATIMYSTDADDKAPPHENWMDALGPYTKNQEIVHCPQFETPDDYGYAFNAGV